MRKPLQVRFYGKRPLILVGTSIFLLIGGINLSLRTVRHAQQQQPPSTQNTLPKDVQDLMSTFDDIGELKVLTPLKLTPEQIDKITACVTEGQAEYNKKNNEMITATIRGLTDVIKRTKKEALQGKAGQGEEQVVKAMNVLIPKRLSLETTVMTVMSDKVIAILTPKQQETMAKIARESQGKKEGKDATTTTQWCKLYIYRVLAGYGRAVTVLNELKAEAEGTQQ